jgi:hypothetical protein
MGPGRLVGVRAVESAKACVSSEYCARVRRTAALPMT